MEHVSGPIRTTVTMLTALRAAQRQMELERYARLLHACAGDHEQAGRVAQVLARRPLA